MADGSVSVMSLVERALTRDGWRRIRHRLPIALRRRMPMNPPEPSSRAREWLRRILRERRRMIAEEAQPVWTPKVSAVATGSGHAPKSLAEWADGAGIPIVAGRLQIRGDIVAWANAFGASVATSDEAIAWLDAALAAPRAAPPDASPAHEQCPPSFIDMDIGVQTMLRKDAGFPFRTLAFGEIGSFLLALADRWNVAGVSIQEPDYPRLGERGEPVTVNELSALLTISNRKLRRLLKAAGLEVRPNQTIPSRWFRSPAARRFWEAVDRNHRRKHAVP